MRSRHSWLWMECSSLPMRSTSCSASSRVAATRCSGAITRVLEIKPGPPSTRRWKFGEGRLRRLSTGDRSLWSGAVDDNRVGRLHITEPELTDIKQLHGFAKEHRCRYH